MAFLLGIDLGTSSVKCVLFDETGEQIAQAHEEYDILSPAPGFAEQDPNAWWESTAACVARALDGHPSAAGEIAAIGLSGQMHGTVALDRENRPVQNAILHCDARSGGELEEIYKTVGRERFCAVTGNPLFTGFQPASLCWLRRRRPEAFARIRRVVLPKDHIRYRLTGELGTERTDASGATLLDIRTGDWSDELIAALGLDRSWFSPIASPGDIAGEVTAEAARATGLRAGTPVVYGAADQPAQALGNGAVRPGIVTSTIGTGGQIFSPTARPVLNPAGNTHTFLHAPEDIWYLLGASLSAGLSLKWFSRHVLGRGDYGAMDREAAQVPAGTGPLFLPYLNGERTPHLDPDARGVFFGLGLTDDWRTMYRAVLDGVVFALRDSLGVIESLGGPADTVIASGGGARSDLWLQIQADVFDREIVTTHSDEQANLGAAILAGAGCGLYASIGEACAALVRPGEKKAWPISGHAAAYEEKYQRYRALYPHIRDLYRQ